MLKKFLLPAFAAFALATVLAPDAARADAIDGHWCHDKEGRMTISGPDIVTPGGTQTRGVYGRHSFSYTVPAAEPRAGTTLFMTLIDDDTVHLRDGANTAAPPAPQVWHRCRATTS